MRGCAGSYFNLIYHVGLLSLGGLTFSEEKWGQSGSRGGEGGGGEKEERKKGKLQSEVICGRRISFKRKGKQGLDLFGREIKALIAGVG